MIIKPMIRNNICMNAHPVGCRLEVLDQIAYAKRIGKTEHGPSRVLVIGSSTGYGLASRICAAYRFSAATVGVSFEREAADTRTATMGWYNTRAFELEAKKDGLRTASINGDAYSREIKDRTVELIRRELGSVDLIVYSLASPVRTDPETGISYRSVLKPIGRAYTAKSINPETGEIRNFSLEPATDEEIENTVKVMGGEDWKLWIDTLADAGVLAPGARTVAYSYIGPEVTRGVYREGTIGMAKEHLERTAAEIRESLAAVGGTAYVSVNKALVTRASAVIPVVPLYLALLFKVMKAKGIHEGCIEQIGRLFGEKLFESPVPTDEEGRIRMDDWELRADVQDEIDALWPRVTDETIGELGDLSAYHEDFLRIHGFGRPDVDYDQDVDPRMLD